MKNLQAVSLGIGDRDLPLEADLQSEIDRDADIVGEPTEVSSVAGGDLESLRGKPGRILGVLRRFGVIVGYEVEIGDKTKIGTAKDFYVGREVLEDIQPPTATSVAIRQALAHWGEQRDYWGDLTEGVESLMFALASATPVAGVDVSQGGWKLSIPDPRGERTIVNCGVIHHDNVWTMSTAVYPERQPVKEAIRVADHWGRVFAWSEVVAQEMVGYGFPWEKALRNLRLRSATSVKILRPLLISALQRVEKAKKELGISKEVFSPYGMSIGFSRVRLKPGTIGLTEAPTDLRPYTVISISPDAGKSAPYLEQVVLHEALHIGVGSRGGRPHNEEFKALAKKVGLKPKYQD